MIVQLVVATYPKASYSRWGRCSYTLAGGRGRSYGHIGLLFLGCTREEQRQIVNVQRGHRDHDLHRIRIGEDMVFELLNNRAPCFAQWDSMSTHDEWGPHRCKFRYELKFSGNGGLATAKVVLLFSHALRIVRQGYTYSNCSYFNACVPGGCNLHCVFCGLEDWCGCQWSGIRHGHCSSIVYMVLANAYVGRALCDPITTISEAEAAMPLDHPRRTSCCWPALRIPLTSYSPTDLAHALQARGIAYDLAKMPGGGLYCAPVTALLAPLPFLLMR